MLRRVAIERFRGLRELVATVDATTVVLGPNSCGKTSFLHAIRLACDVCELALELPGAAPRTLPNGTIEVCSAKTTIVPEPARVAALADFRLLFLDADVSDGSDLRIRLGFDAGDPVTELAVRLVYSRNAQLKLEVIVKSPGATSAVANIKPKSKARPSKLRAVLDVCRPIAHFVPAFYGVTRTEEYRTQPLVSRMLGGGDQSHIVRNLVARLDAPAFDRLNGFLARTVGATLTSRTTDAEADKRADLEVRYRDRNGELELSSAGSGVVGLVALYAAMQRSRRERERMPERTVLFLLDEPEAHLHPRLAADVAEEIVVAGTEFGMQLLLATHSIDVANRLGGRDATKLLWVDRNRTEPITLSSETELVDALDTFCDLTPFATLSFLRSRRLLLVEGPSDKRLLEACARVLYQTNDAALLRFRHTTIVELDGVGNASVKLVEKLLSPVAFSRVNPERVVRVAVALDRDWVREPSQLRKLQPQRHLETVQVVWSQHSVESLFLSAPVLTAWLGAHLGGPHVKALVDAALAAADKDPELQQEAEDGRFAFHRRQDPKTKTAPTESEARKRARADVREAPAVFQSGKARAKFVLHHVRHRLAPEQAKRLRGSLVDLVAGADPAQLSPASAVPAEVQSFLNEVVAPLPPAVRKR